MTGSPAPNIPEQIANNARANPDATACEFLADDGSAQALSRGDLMRRAAALAVGLSDAAAADGPVLIVEPPGLDYVVSLVACLLAGVPAVPAYPPEIWRSDASLERLRRLVEDAQPTHFMAADMFRPAIAGMGLAAAPVIPADAGPDEIEPVRRPGGKPAILQYTSGTTGDPRGVIVTFDNLRANVESISDVFGIRSEDRALVWLPPYHDMGLVGGIITPLAAGIAVRLMSSVTFMKDPLSWLRQITEFGATLSGGPNFAYDLCVRRAADQSLDDVELGSWRLAFNGAEPVQRDTLRRFARRFAPHGFRRRAFFPCYGLAEATLIVSGEHWEADDSAQDHRVPCGPPVAGTKVRVADPDSGRRLAAGQEGEIWLRGPSVSPGYWRAAPSAQPFVQCDDGQYLRTGDIGWMTSTGRLIVTGRMKDLIIWRGRNYAPSDVEESAVRACPGLRPVAAAFSCGEGAQQRVVLVAETRRGYRASDGDLQVIRERVYQDVGLPVHEICLVESGYVPRTSSGKVQRHVCRTQYARGQLAAHGAGRTGASGASSGTEDGVRALTELACGVFAGVCEVPACSADDSFLALGGDSLRAATAVAAFERALGLSGLSPDLVLECGTPHQTAVALVGAWRAADRDLAALADRLAQPSGSAREQPGSQLL